MKIKPGMEGKDKVTGFVGIVGGICKYLYGCDSVLLTPKCTSDNSFQDGKWFDLPRIEKVGEGILPEDVTGDKPGGDITPPVK